MSNNQERAALLPCPFCHSLNVGIYEETSSDHRSLANLGLGFLDAPSASDKASDDPIGEMQAEARQAKLDDFVRVTPDPGIAPASQAISSEATGRFDALIDAAEKRAEIYEDDDRQGIKTDVINAFYAGAKFASADQRYPWASLRDIIAKPLEPK